MKLFFYSLLLLFCLGTLITELNNKFRSIWLIVYSLNSTDYFFKDKLYLTERLRGSNSSGSQGSFTYFGIIESTQNEGSIKGWIEKMKVYRKFDKIKNKTIMTYGTVRTKTLSWDW